MSAETTAAAPPHRQIRLVGPSVALDPAHHAVRRDLAELAVADRVFAQHYAAPMAVRATATAAVRARPAIDADVVATLDEGATFCVLDVGKSWAWGRGTAAGSTGYVAAASLDLP